MNARHGERENDIIHTTLPSAAERERDGERWRQELWLCPEESS